MRIFVKLFFGAACVSLVGVLTASCASTGCDGPGTCQPPVGPVSDSSGEGGVDGGGPDTPAGCTVGQGPKESPACIEDSFAVFVSPTGDDGAKGTKTAPVRSITKGVALATYDKNVQITAPLAVFGGVTCGWAPSETTRPKLAPAKGIALQVTKVVGAVVVQDLDVLGAADSSTPGDSAIAAFVSESTNVTFRRVNLSAGAGIEGARGTSRSNYAAGAAKSGANANAANGGGETPCACTDVPTARRPRRAVAAERLGPALLMPPLARRRRLSAWPTRAPMPLRPARQAPAARAAWQRRAEWEAKGRAS